MRVFLVAVMVCVVRSSGRAASVSPLFARGYTVIPEPQKVSLGTKDFSFDQTWQVKLDRGVAKDDIAVEALREDLSQIQPAAGQGRQRRRHTLVADEPGRCRLECAGSE